ncbi:hypothetical protein [Methylotuvimicrobium sp.]|uniref:hypothetical protein n=1 Tax=Methylotuvimicrobium sp. TaxID=2822413 RepID=UPI003D659751
MIDSIKGSGSVDQAFSACINELQFLMGSEFQQLDENALKAIFSTIVAAQFAEYGNSSAVSYEKIKDSEYLNCGNTILLAGYLYGTDKNSLRSIGFDGGAIGNHAQLLYLGDTQLLLDPTTGLVAQVGFDDLLSGTPVPLNKIRMFTVKAKTIDSFRKKVFLAVIDGKYRPSDFMYMHESISEHLKKGSSDNYFTPGGIYIRNILRNKQSSSIDWKQK